MDGLDRQIVAATQNGLALVARPYGAVAEAVGVAEDEVIVRMRRLLERGAIRRIGVVPNHYALGVTANGMSVWDIEDARVAEVGEAVGAIDFVSHCYERLRHPPTWPYNFFAMVHGRSRAEVAAKVERMATLIGAAARGHDVLFSTRILKKTGLRIAT